MSEPQPLHLVGRFPSVTPVQLLSGLVPPPQFAAATFSSYQPDPAHPSQQAALERVWGLAEQLKVERRRSLFRRPPQPQSIYLDGGFGVGKTHLLAALAAALGPGRAAYGTFVEYTHLVGALGFAACVEELAGKALVAIDEFELDDPGDTVLMARLLRELADHQVTLAATSNTLPEALGEGRFAAEDFLREIQALSARFDVVRIEGPDYRMRDGRPDHEARSRSDVERIANRALEAGVPSSLDSFDDLMAHLALVHPSHYGRLLDQVDLVCLIEASSLDDDHLGLRFVVLVDRLYDRNIPVRLSGVSISGLFSDRMLTKGYRKKYYRALSRLASLAALSVPGVEE